MPELPGVEHRFVDVRGARMHVADSGGSGPPVVLLHGWPQHWWTWRRVIELLRDDARVIAIDLRGFGWSEATLRGYRKEELAQDVVGVLDALALDSVFLVGHDWGGVVGFIVCLQHPDRVRRYVVMSEVQRFAPRFAEPARARAAQQVYRTFLLHDYPSWVRGRFASQRLTTPTLWINGEQDPVLKRGSVEDVDAHADDVGFAYLPDCGHFPPQERPNLVAERLRAFFLSAAS